MWPAELALPTASRRESISLPSSTSGATCAPVLLDSWPLGHLQRQQEDIPHLWPLLPSLNLLTQISLTLTLVTTLDPHQIVQDHLPISRSLTYSPSSKSHLPRMVTYSWIPGIDVDIFPGEVTLSAMESMRHSLALFLLPQLQTCWCPSLHSSSSSQAAPLPCFLLSGTRPLWLSVIPQGLPDRVGTALPVFPCRASTARRDPALTSDSPVSKSCSESQLTNTPILGSSSQSNSHC